MKTLSSHQQMAQKLDTKRITILLIISIGLVNFSGNDKTVYSDKDKPFYPVTLDAADSILAQMSLEEKLAQFFVIKNPKSLEAPLPGGVIVNSIDGISKLNIPGDSFRPIVGVSLADNGELFNAERLSSVKNQVFIESYAASLAGYLKANNIDFVTDFGLDIYQNDQTPYGDLSFSSNADEVAEIGQAIYRGFKKQRLVAVASNFPGLGNTTRGYEQSPAMVYTQREALYENELVPFKCLINDGLQSVMMANAFVPALDNSHNAMASTSPIIHNLLRENLGFNGLIWSDLSINAPSVNKEFPASIGSFLAGSDVIIINDKLQENIYGLKQLITQEIISLEEIDERCKRVLQSKVWMLKNKNASSIAATGRSLHQMNRQLYSRGLVLLKNDDALPITQLDTSNIAVLKIGSASAQLREWVTRYTEAEVFELKHDHIERDFNAFWAEEDRFDLIIVLADEEPMRFARKRFGMSETTERILTQITTVKRSILVWNGSLKGLTHIKDTPKLQALLAAHGTDEYADDLSLQALFGGRKINGELRKRLQRITRFDTVFDTKKTRLAYGFPEEVGIASGDLDSIEKIARKGISEMAYPGCQVWFAKDSIVIYNKSFGHHTYQNDQAVKNTDLYDLASITKIAASAAGLMKLTDQGKFNLDHRLCDYLSEWVDTTEYMQLTMREILAHQAGLTPWIPFYQKTLSKGVPRYDVYSLAQSPTYPLQVARELYIKADYPDVMFSSILNTKLNSKKEYKYSDVGYYFVQKIIEKQTRQPMDQFLDSNFYRPLGLSTLGYHPLARFKKEQIAPTELDRIFRNQLVHGYVHDPGAAMMGGIGGHAGLFSNANDLGVLMQMYLNGGEYGGKQYLNKETIKDFTRCQFCDNDNRRGASFDKPLTDGSEGPSCGCTDLEAFGHQGFTGTVTWADPEENTVYVFLSNRVYPNASNKKLLELNIRTDLQKTFYKAIERSKKLASE
ncbi:MAG: serine hydrolase [Salibacteraceae bacterium]